VLLAVAWLLGPWRPWGLPDAPSLVPKPGQSHIHTVLVASGWAAALNAALCALLLATSRRWAREPSRPHRAAPRSRGLGRSSWLLLLAAAALAGVLRWPLAHGSVWWDEAWSVRNAIVGRREPVSSHPGRVSFEPAPWRKTFWYYHAPTNHVAYSVAARLTTGAWRRATGAPPGSFDEFALRLPSFAAALASVVLVGVLVAELGFATAAPAAAFLLALHPLHVRFGADGRGYSFVVLFTLGGAWLLRRALRDGRWRWWLAYGASQLLLLWTFPLAVYVPLAFALAAAAAIAFGAEPPGGRSLAFQRFAVANVLAGMAFLQLMAPNLAQAAGFQKEWHDEGRLDLRSLRSFWVMLATGLPLKAPRLPDVSFPTLANLAAARPWILPIVYGVLPALAALGLARGVARARSPERAVWAGLVGASALFLAHRALQPFFVLPRFAIFGLGALVPLLALGLEGAGAAVAEAAGGRRGVAAGVVALGLAGFAGLVSPELRVLGTHPATPSREVVAFLRQQGDVLRAGLGLGGDAPRVYDPEIVEVERLDELAALCARARAEGRPFYVFYAYLSVNQKRMPELFRLVRDPRYFEPVARFDGIEGDLVIRVHRYTGLPLDGNGT
jgi:hypothetical protein